MNLEKGQKVHYIGHEGATPENGIVKKVNLVMLGYVYVVYSCAGNWSEYENYTGQLTDTDHLHEGWVEPEQEPFV